MYPGVLDTRRYRLSLSATLLTVAGLAIGLGTLGPGALVVVAAMAVIGALAGGISAGIQVVAREAVTSLLASGHQQGGPEPGREPPTLLVQLLRLSERRVRRLAEAPGRHIPLIVGSALAASVFGLVSWWLVGPDPTLIRQNLTILLVLTLLLAALVFVIVLIGRKLIPWPTVRTRLLIGVQVLWDITGPIRAPDAAWPRPLARIHWLLFASPVWLRVTLGWVLAATDFFFLYLIFDSLGFELLYHPPAQFSWAMWLIDLLAMAILVRAHYDIARSSFSRDTSMAWGVAFSIIVACSWFYLRGYLIAGGVYLFLVLSPILGTSVTRPDPFRIWLFLAIVIALFVGKSLVRAIRPIVPRDATGASTAPQPRRRAMIVLSQAAIVLGCLLAVIWIVQMQWRAETYIGRARSNAARVAQFSPKAVPVGTPESARDRARFEHYYMLLEKYSEAASHPWRRVEPDPPEPQ